ncbi:unnamed protein product [Brachionus calyciflorus]|uniref:FLYWCH-type domain-containing protein n=1 Tax=Brachionus calyciflorus TaxID=104777 RepID=A0A814CMM0_9BILA|nr:unnamed protein product [Brachionus calyciflorus]
MDDSTDFFYINDGDTLVRNNHLYYLHRTNKTYSKYWRCKAEKCPASITISTNEIIMRENAEHIETPFKDIKIEAVQLVSSITEKCSTETIPISQIYDQEIARICTKYDAATVELFIQISSSFCQYFKKLKQIIQLYLSAPKRRKKDVEKDKRLRDSITTFIMNEISLEKFFTVLISIN